MVHRNYPTIDTALMLRAGLRLWFLTLILHALSSGQAISASVAGEDSVGRHLYELLVIPFLNEQGAYHALGASYAFTGWPVDFSIDGFRMRKMMVLCLMAAKTIRH